MGSWSTGCATTRAWWPWKEVNARHLTPELLEGDFPEGGFDWIVVTCFHLAGPHPARAVALLAPQGQVLLLVKPQFELQTCRHRQRRAGEKTNPPTRWSRPRSDRCVTRRDYASGIISRAPSMVAMAIASTSSGRKPRLEAAKKAAHDLPVPSTGAAGAPVSFEFFPQYP